MRSNRGSSALLLKYGLLESPLAVWQWPPTARIFIYAIEIIHIGKLIDPLEKNTNLVEISLRNLNMTQISGIESAKMRNNLAHIYIDKYI